MAFHIPFNQRNQDRQGPVYIGFNDPPRLRRPRFNWWAFNGLWMSLAAFASAGFLSIIPFFVSWRGLKRKPRKMAVAGMLFSVIGMCIAGAITVHGVGSEMKREQARQQVRERREMARLKKQCEPILSEAAREFEQYRENNDGYLPNAINGNMVVIKHIDPWGTSLRFEPEANDHALIRSAGPDKEWDTRDDITHKVDGKTDREFLLPLDEDF